HLHVTLLTILFYTLPPFSFFSHAPPTTAIYPLSLHDALPICSWRTAVEVTDRLRAFDPDDPVRFDFSLAHLGISGACKARRDDEDRKSTRLNSSHVKISYAVFCLKKKTKTSNTESTRDTTITT